DGNIWFTELGSGQIGQFVLGDRSRPAPPSAPATRETPASAATLNALLEGARLQAIDGLASQPPTVARVDAAFPAGPLEAGVAPTRPQALSEAGSPSHLHPMDRAATSDVAGLADPLTEDPVR